MTKKFPVFTQSEPFDCGPTCLRMICSYYENPHSIEYIKSISGLNENGVSMYNLEQAAKRLGFDSFGVKYTLQQLFENQLPCIVHWNARHFVVVPPQVFNGNTVLVANPSNGQSELSLDDFLKGWLGENPDQAKGYVLHVNPLKTGKKKIKKVLAPFAYFSNYLVPHRNKFIIIFVLLLLAGLITFLNPFISKNIIDKGVNRKDIYFVFMMLVAQLFLFLGTTSTDLIRNWILLHINNAFGISVLHDFLLKLTKLPISYFDRKNVGDLQQRISDHTRIQYFLTSNSISIVFSVVNFVALFVTLACFSGSILAIISFFTIVNIFWIFYFLKRRKEIDYARFYNRGHNQDNINEIILGMQDIKLNDLESYKLNNWYRTQEEQNMLSLKMMKVDQRQLIGSSSLNQLENIIISFFSALAVIKGNMTLGMMMSINLITGQLKGAITQFLYLTQAFQEASISLDRLMEIHNNKNEDEGSKGLTLTGSNIYSLELKNVSFKYASEGEFILKNISMTIPIGKTIAIVGGSGSGKTTLMKVLLKYHDAIEGSVVINKAIDLREISSKWWWQQCGVVMQEGFIFSDTIDNNIAVIVSEDEMEKMKTAKKIANVYDFIESMPDNGKTKIGATGNGISGGQKQRLLIARALYKNPEMLFFDEATSSLDSENEELIMQNIERQFNGKTKVIIAHRYSTIKNADIIFVLDKGEIVETGTHEQLMTEMGQYHKLFSSQMVAEKLTNDSAVV